MSLEVNGELIPVGGGDPIPLVDEVRNGGQPFAVIDTS